MDRDPLTPGPSRDPSLLDVEAVARELEVDPLTGLSEDEAARRLAADGANELRRQAASACCGARSSPSSRTP